MSTHPSNSPSASADAAFASALKVPQALLDSREHFLNQAPMRDLALNRSVVVLTVAAWQGWVETYVEASLDAMISGAEPVTDGHWPATVASLTELARREVRRFSTPDAAGVRHLLKMLGDDPLPRWSFEVTGGSRDESDVVGRLNDWILVRHSIAHGARHLPIVGVLGLTKGGHGSLTHRHAARCIRFFDELASATGRRGLESA